VTWSPKIYHEARGGAPTLVLLATYCCVHGSLLIRINTLVHIALFAILEPPRLSLCLTIFPEDASIGLTPHSAVNEYSFFKRSGLSPAATKKERRSNIRPYTILAH